MFKKVKAGALQLTMFIVIVIALLLTAFIILINTHKRLNIQTDFVLETIGNANKGIGLVIESDIRLNDTTNINLRDEDFKNLKVHLSYWGLFEKVVSSSKIKTNTFKKMALIGALQPQTNRTVLYVEDQNKPLVLVGNTKIQGLVYLPRQGVRTGNISGHSYYGSQLIYGMAKESGKLPEILKETLEQLKIIQNKVDGIDQNQFLDLSKTKTYQNSFLNPIQVIFSNSELTLSDVSITGHILIQSKTKIVVEASSTLTDVILIAPEIEIKNNTKGAFQAMATKEITIGENCSLSYPSAFVLNEDVKIVNNNTSNNQTPFIKVGKGSNLKGVIVYWGETKNYMAQVFIDEGVTITGEVYCNQNLELLGTVHGSVFTSNFIANQSGSSYQNHVYNATMSIDSLPQEYVGLTFENSNKGVMKWLY